MTPGVATDAVMDPRRWPGAVRNRRRMLLRTSVREVEILNKEALLQLRRGNPGAWKEKGVSNRKGLETRRGQHRLRVRGLLPLFPTSGVAKMTEAVSIRVAGLCARL